MPRHQIQRLHLREISRCDRPLFLPDFAANLRLEDRVALEVDDGRMRLAIAGALLLPGHGRSRGRRWWRSLDGSPKRRLGRSFGLGEVFVVLSFFTRQRPKRTHDHERNPRFHRLADSLSSLNARVDRGARRSERP